MKSLKYNHDKWKKVKALCCKWLSKSSNGFFSPFDKCSLSLVYLGVDIPEVDWVIQFDAPSNAEAFVHRCGRTARSGQRGRAIVFLLPTERTYIDFIGLNQRVALTEMSLPQENLPNLLPILRDWQKNDRSIFDMANRAFVSFVQAYSKHECKYILRLKGNIIAFTLVLKPFLQKGA